MTETEVRERVWAYIVENFLYMRPNFQVDPDDSLLRRNLLAGDLEAQRGDQLV